MELKRSWNEIRDSILKKRALMEQTDWSDSKYDDMYKRANDNFNELEQYVYSIIE